MLAAQNQKVLKFIRNNFGFSVNIKLLNDGCNLTYLIKQDNKKYILKLINDLSSNYQVEKLICDKVYPKKYLIEPGKVKNYICYEYIDGNVLAELPSLGADSQVIVDGLITFICQVGKIKSDNVGILDNRLSGNYGDWVEFIRNYMNGQMKKGKKMPSYAKEINSYLAILPEVLGELTLKTIPMDLNLKNFVFKSNKIYPINVPVVWRGDYLAPYGEIASHIYQTELWPVFWNKISSAEHNPKAILIYMYFMAYTTLVFISNHSSISLRKAKPWGNNRATFVDILNDCQKMIKKY